MLFPAEDSLCNPVLSLLTSCFLAYLPSFSFYIFPDLVASFIFCTHFLSSACSLFFSCSFLQPPPHLILRPLPDLPIFQSSASCFPFLFILCFTCISFSSYASPVSPSQGGNGASPDNLLALAVIAARERASLGEISFALETEWGRHVATTQVVQGETRL